MSTSATPDSDVERKKAAVQRALVEVEYRVKLAILGSQSPSWRDLDDAERAMSTLSAALNDL